MSKMICVAIMDKKMGRFERPFFVTHSHEAVRAIQQHINKGSEVGFVQYPEDFAVYILGHVDTVSGEFEDGSRPEFLVEVSALKGGAK